MGQVTSDKDCELLQPNLSTLSNGLIYGLKMNSDAIPIT